MRRLKWWLLLRLHPLVHRHAYKPCWICNLAWRNFDKLATGLRQAQADLVAGRGTPWRDLR